VRMCVCVCACVSMRACVCVCVCVGGGGGGGAVGYRPAALELLRRGRSSSPPWLHCAPATAPIVTWASIYNIIYIHTDTYV
jgi:hypothetical protein